MYYLVLLQPGRASSDPRLNAEHEAFIDGLIRRNQILLGGNLLPRSDLPAGYLLVCGSREQAEELVEGDPYVRQGVFRPQILEWQLVAINPEAVDPGLVVRPRDLE
ncbi:MAG: YciI family protein [Thermoplasmata archaeon]